MAEFLVAGDLKSGGGRGGWASGGPQVRTGHPVGGGCGGSLRGVIGVPCFGVDAVFAELWIRAVSFMFGLGGGRVGGWEGGAQGSRPQDVQDGNQMSWMMCDAL